jgi:hypothetical protein
MTGIGIYSRRVVGLQAATLLAQFPSIRPIGLSVDPPASDGLCAFCLAGFKPALAP